MDTFSALLAICAGNSPVTGEFPAQRLVTQSFGVLFDLQLNKRLSKQSRGWWFETTSRLLWRPGNNLSDHKSYFGILASCMLIVSGAATDNVITLGAPVGHDSVVPPTKLYAI